MKKTFGHSIFWLALLALVALFACACSGDDKQAGGATEETQIAIEDKTVAGVSEKGPFTVGSAVHIYELEFETLGHTGRSIPGKIASDRGDFRFTHLNLECQFAFMEVSGYYRNENTGKQSTAPITLNALVDLSDKETANINLLTHLAFERTLFLVNEGKPVKDAKQQAEQEILKAFYIENELIGDFEGLSIFKKGEGNAALLAISSLMQADLAEGDFSERLANFAYDIEKDGVWNDSVTATAVADWASAVSLSTYYSAIRSNIKDWKISDIIPDFEKSMDKFWWENYGLGDCDKEREGVVKANTNALSKLNGVHFICKDNLWRLASDIEKDTYKWKAGKDGDVKFGDVVKTNCYVYEDKVWRAGEVNDCSLGLRGCTTLRQDTVGQGSDKNWYKCVSQTWRTATNIEKDTAAWGVGEFDGEIRPGQVNKGMRYIYEDAKKVWREATEIEVDTYQKDCLKDGKLFNGNVNSSAMYVCDAGKFRIASDMEILGELGCTSYNRDGYHILTQVSYPHIDSIGSWDMTYRSDKISKNYSYYKCTENGWKFTREKLNQGTMVDERDGQEYKTIGIGSQVWMAENLNYAATSSVCPLENSAYCTKYGRLYLPGGASTYCPSGWHVPSLSEWTVLYNYVDANNGTEGVGKSLKSSMGWYEAGTTVGKRMAVATGKDQFGFSALPAGSCWCDTPSWNCYSDDEARFLASGGEILQILYDSDVITQEENSDGTNVKVSVRCLKGAVTSTTTTSSSSLAKKEIDGCTCDGELTTETNDLASDNPVEYTWSVTGCSSEGAEPLSYIWSGSVSGTKSSVTASYTKKGEYTPSVTVTNADGNTKDVTCPSAYVVDSDNPYDEIEFPSGRLGPGGYYISKCSEKWEAPSRATITLAGGSSDDCLDWIDNQQVTWGSHWGYCGGNIQVEFPLYITIPAGEYMSFQNCY